jgi:nuclear pore complex protein Nup107
VRELDPDAPTRTGGVWDARDAEYDAVLARSLFSYVRAGNTDEAIRICGEVDMPFRAAVMRGAYPFEWDEISAFSLDSHYGPPC